jgi:hypothetical protein
MQPAERPERRRRTNNNSYRETVLNTSVPNDNMPLYPQTTLPSLAPANSFSPAAPHDTAPLTSSFHAGSSTPQGGGPGRMAAQYPESTYPQSSPLATVNQPSMPYQQPVPGVPPHDINGASRGVPQKPERPEDPYKQFTMHMRPQLENDYPPADIPGKIQFEWENLSHDNRKLWEDRYLGQMQEYEAAMDAWKKARRDNTGSGGFPGSSG